MNDPETHVGEGFVNYTIKAKETAVTGDVIDAQARIIFDVNDPIDTPPIFNTIDADLPSSQLENSTQPVNETTFTLNRTAQDTEGGSGLQDVTLFMSTDDQPYQTYEANLTDTSMTVTLDPGHIYKFFTIANDNAGNAEPMKNKAEAVIDLSSGVPIAGDINQDRQIDLTDAILAIKIVAGIEPDTVINRTADINGDGKTGLEEAFYVLRKLLQ
ncbi:MAG: hypothetical protein GY749_33350 [Desulfobacteraceae bacterium]|nr:hypothetical protein [Desulfobacteraceae bacterium]